MQGKSQLLRYAFVVVYMYIYIYICIDIHKLYKLESKTVNFENFLLTFFSGLGRKEVLSVQALHFSPYCFWLFLSQAEPNAES